MEITIREAEKSEAKMVLFLFEEGALSLEKRGINQWRHWIHPTPELMNRVEKDIANKAYFFVEKSGAIAGMFRLMDSDEEYWGQQTDAAIYLHSFMTKPAFKGQNIGSTVLKLVEMKVREREIPYFRLDCKADNSDLCKYYENQGFVPIRKKVMPHYEVQLFEKKVNQ
jgi:ribosomal protein S18 acetylase RimI-like enzyme